MSNRLIHWNRAWRKLGLIMIVLAAAACLLPPGTADAHAVVERYAPEPGSKLEAAPPEAALQFNEAIEASVGSMKLLNSKSGEVDTGKPELSEDRKHLTLPLPKLGEGVYTVAYRVVSLDGHPISGSYVFVVGDPPEAKDASAFNLHTELGHSGHSAFGVATDLGGGAAIVYALRFLYYAALLLASGFAIWRALYRESSTASRVFHSWTVWLTRALLVAVLLFVFIHARELLEGEPQSEWGRLFSRTTVGLVWDGVIVLALLGYPAIRAGRLVAAVWGLALLALESWSGHAAVYEPKALTVAMDFIHLAASAVWAGGLALLLGLWFSAREETRRFAPAFSRMAWLSILLLVVTGTAEALLFLPGLSYLFYTSWGTLLLAKTAAVLLVIVTGFLLRRRVRRGGTPPGGLLKLDAALMGVIVLIVAMFTYISPLPANEPVSAHLMGEELHYTLRVTPNVPGDNEIILKVWLPEGEGAPKSVQVRLWSEDKKELGPIDIPLASYEDTELDSFTGFSETDYKAEGPFIPFAGNWRAEIRILDPQDNEKVFEQKFRNY